MTLIENVIEFSDLNLFFFKWIRNEWNFISLKKKVQPPMFAFLTLAVLRNSRQNSCFDCTLFNIFPIKIVKLVVHLNIAFREQKKFFIGEKKTRSSHLKILVYPSSI